MNTHDIFGLRSYSTDWQHLVCLLYALEQLGAGGHRRREVCEHIHKEGYLKLNREDNTAYPTQSEPSWQTDIAYARKIGVIMGIIGYTERDSWEFIRDGRDALNKIKKAGDDGGIDGKELYLLSTPFRRQFDQSYHESAADRARPLRQLRRGCNKNVVLIVNGWIRSGEAEANAERLSKELGFRVFPDKISLVYAGEFKYERIMASLL